MYETSAPIESWEVKLVNIQTKKPTDIPTDRGT